MEKISSFLVKECWKQWVCEHYQCSEHLQDHTVYRNKGTFYYFLFNSFNNSKLHISTMTKMILNTSFTNWKIQVLLKNIHV